MDRMVEVVVGPVAKDVRQAWAELVELRRVESHLSLGGMPGKELVDLFRQLLDRYPPFEDDPATPWGDFPMILYFGDRLATVSIVESRAAEALPFVITTALRLGLTVFDATGERIHRPDGEQVLPTSVTVGSPRYDRLEEHARRSASTPPKVRPTEADSRRKQRSGMILTGGCFLALLAVITLWTALMLSTGWATSMAWGERDEPGQAILWIREDVPLLLRIAAGSLVAAAILLFIGGRRMKASRVKGRRGSDVAGEKERT